MARIEGEIAINRPVDEVFDLVADERNEPRYNPRIARVEKLTSGPIGCGTRFRAEAASWPRAVPMTIKYTAYERPGGWPRRSGWRPPTSREPSPSTSSTARPACAGHGR